MSPDTPDVTPENASADVNATEGATPAVKKPRAPRKTAAQKAAEAAAGGDAPASDAEAPAAPRKRARKTAEAGEPVAAESAPAAEATPAGEVLEVREPRPPRARRTPAAAAAVEATAPAGEAAERGSDDAGRQVAQGDAGGDAQASSQGGESGEAGEGREGRRSRNRRRRRGRRGGGGDDAPGARADGAEGDDEADGDASAEADADAEPGEDDGEGRPPRGERGPRPERGNRPIVEFSTADVSDTFAGVLSGDYDNEPELAEGESAIPAKRVLAAEPDAPKLHKVLAQSGIGSRRDMEQLITDGKVTVNGEVAHTGQRISFGDEVRVAGRVVKLRIAPPPARVIAYHKPAGEVVTMDDPEKRPTVFRRLPRLAHGKWQSVGRLDINTEGLLLFTNSGDLANKLMHPRFGVEREYAVRVLGTLDMESREKLLAGVSIDGQEAHFKSIEDGGGEGANRWYRVVITEGRNREVRKLFDAVGMAVSRLIRIRYGSVVLPKGLRRSVWVDLDENDVRRLRQLAGADNGGGQQQRGDKPQREDGGQQQPRGDKPQRGERSDRGDRGPRGENGQRASTGGGQQQPPKQRDRDRGRNRDRGGRQDQSPAPFREAGDPAYIPNPLQQTFDRRAIQQRERPVIADYDDESDGPIGPIPNPLQQTYDKRGVSGNANAFMKGGKGKRGGGGGGGGGEKQPDPLKTAVGYIGADTFIKKLNNRGGGGGGGRGRGRR